MNLFSKLIQTCLDKECAPKFTFWGVVILIGIFFLSLNTLYPVYLDDWHYSFNLVNGERLSSISDILHSQYAHYFEWGGRTVLHTIAQGLLWLGEPWCDIINTIAYITFVLILYSIANNGNKTNTILFIYINVFIWFALPSLSQNLIWTTGSANYLWGSLLVLSLLYFYTSYYLSDNEQSNNRKSIGIFFLAILAGWTNENIGLALIFFLIGLFILLKLQKRKIPLWMIVGLTGAIIGCAFMILAPGNAIRSKNDLWVAHQLKETNLSFYFYRFITVIKLSFKHLLIPVGIYLLLLALYWKKAKTDKKKERLYLSLLFICTAIVATAAMSGSPMFPERAWFGILILLITGAMILYANIDFSNQRLRIINHITFIAILIIFLTSYKLNHDELSKFSNVCKKREQFIKEERSKGILNIVVSDTEFKQKESPLTVLDLQDWMMIDPGWDARLSKYYNVNSINFNKVE